MYKIIQWNRTSISKLFLIVFYVFVIFFNEICCISYTSTICLLAKYFVFSREYYLPKLKTITNIKNINNEIK